MHWMTSTVISSMAGTTPLPHGVKFSAKEGVAPLKLYNLVPTDSPVNDWLFWYEDNAGYVRPREIYADLVCAVCGKLDEEAAISRGIDSSVAIRSKRDFIEMRDGLISASMRLRDAFNEEGLMGVRFIPLPDGNHSVLLPEVRVATDLNTAGFEFVGPKCATCGRYSEVLVGPLVPSLTVPDDPMVVFASEVWNENTRGRVLWLFAQEPVVKVLKKRRLSGLEIMSAT
jgi:hypothetical protein